MGTTIDDEVRFAIWRRVLIANWHSATTERGVRAFDLEVKKLSRAVKGPIALLQIIGIRSTAPSTPARKAMAALFSKYQEDIACNVTIIEGEGFRAASVRAVASGIVMVSRMRFPHEVVATVEKGTSSVIKHLDEEPRLTSALAKAARDLISQC